MVPAGLGFGPGDTEESVMVVEVSPWWVMPDEWVREVVEVGPVLVPDVAVLGSTVFRVEAGLVEVDASGPVWSDWVDVHGV